MSGRVRRREVLSEEWRMWSKKRGRSSSSNRTDQNGPNQHHKRNRWRLELSSTRDRRDGERLGEERQIRKYARREKSEDGRRCGKREDDRYLKKEDYRMRNKRENIRRRCNYEDNRRMGENRTHGPELQLCMDVKGRERREETRRRNFEDEKQDRSMVNRRNRDQLMSKKYCVSEGNRGFHYRTEDYRSGGKAKDRSEKHVNSRREVKLGTQDCDKKKDKFDPSDFQSLVLSRGLNRVKQMDLNRNVVLVEKVMKGVEVILENEIDHEDYKDYSYKEYSGLLSKSNDNTSNSEDAQKCGNYVDRLKQDSDLENIDQDHSMDFKDFNKPGKNEVSTAINKNHRSPESSSSSEDDAANVCSDISDEDIDDEYMISVMKNVTDNFERKRSVLQRFPNEESFRSRNSETDTKSYVKRAKKSKFESSSTLIMRRKGYSRHLKPRSPDSDLSSNLDPIFDSCQAPMKTLNERFGKTETDIFSDDQKPRDEVRKSYESNCSGNLTNDFDVKYLNLNGDETDQLSISRLPSPRPASASAYMDSAFTKCESEVCEREVFRVCSPSSPWSEAENFPSLSQSGSDLQNRLQQNVATEDEIDVFKDVKSDAGVKKRKFEDETDEEKILNQVDSICVREDKKVVILDVENYLPDLGKEGKYEEPSPEVFEHVDLRADVRFTPITQMMHNVIVNAMLSVSEVVLSRHNIDITKHDLYTLTGTNWLNDQIVEIYLAMIAHRSLSLKYVPSHQPKIHSMSTYFFTNFSTRGYSAVKKWTKEVDIFACDMVLVPIHMDSHWSIASIDFRVPGVFYYDSLGSTVNNNAILTALLYYLSEEHMDKKGKEMNLSNYAKHTMDCPLQQNGSDCGVFCCKVGDYLSRDIQLEFCQEDVKYFRKRMIFEILRGVLLEP